jgi:hypothetical protein
LTKRFWLFFFCGAYSAATTDLEPVSAARGGGGFQKTEMTPPAGCGLCFAYLLGTGGKEMKYVIEERFTDELGFTFEKACSGGRREAIEYLYIMRHSESVFELLDKGRYEIAKRQYREQFNEKFNRAI